MRRASRPAGAARASVGDQEALAKAWRSLVKAERHWRSEAAERKRELD